MDKHYYNPETIEAYIGNKLSMSDKIGFENAIAKDPLLKNEVELQRDIIQSLKDSRKAELKARLNKIDVNAPSNYTGVKVAASILLAGLMSYGIYSYVSSSDSKSTHVVESSETDVKTTNTKIDDSPMASAPSKDVTSSESVDKSANNSPVANPTIGAKEKNRRNSAPSPIAVPEPADMENEQLKNDESISIPEGKIAQETSIKNNLDIKEDNTTSNKFHYKYYNNKLFLYGDFSDKTYEILELNTYKGKQMYLYYNNNFFLLKSNQLEITPLKKITDKKVLSEIQKVNN